MSSSTCCDTPINKTVPRKPTMKLVQRFSADGAIGKGVETVLVDTADVALTLPYQPHDGTEITVAATVTGVTVAPGCSTECCDDDDDEVCDTFCSEEDTIAVPECGLVTFVYFAGDPCADTPTQGMWTSTDSA